MIGEYFRSCQAVGIALLTWESIPDIPVDKMARITLEEISFYLDSNIMLSLDLFKPTITIQKGQTVSLRAVKFYSHLTQFNSE